MLYCTRRAVTSKCCSDLVPPYIYRIVKLRRGSHKSQWKISMGPRKLLGIHVYMAYWVWQWPGWTVVWWQRHRLHSGGPKYKQGTIPFNSVLRNLNINKKKKITKLTLLTKPRKKNHIRSKNYKNLYIKLLLISLLIDIWYFFLNAVNIDNNFPSSFYVKFYLTLQ